MSERKIRSALGLHCDVIDRHPAFEPTACRGELKPGPTYTDRYWNSEGLGESDPLVEMWTCSCGVILAISEGVLLEAYKPVARSARDLVKELAASFELPRVGERRDGA